MADTPRLLPIAKTLSLPIDFVTARVAILGMSGAGKSNAFAVMVEAVYDVGAPFTWFDPYGAAWGARSNAAGDGPGLQVPIFGGYHGDFPLPADKGALIARELYRLDASAILDLSALEQAEQCAFVTAYAKELFALHLQVKKVRAVCVDEAQSLAPQRPASEAEFACSNALARLHTGGRAQGIGLKTATQSAAEQDKRTMKQAELIVALRTFSPLDQKPVIGYVQTSVEKPKADEIKRTLSSLKDGEAWFIAPRWLGKVTRARFALRRTFDSSRTPQVGETVKEPTIIAAVELDRLRVALESDEQGSTSPASPADLSATVARLQRELREAREARPAPEIREVPVLALDATIVAEARDVASELARSAAAAGAAATAIEVALDRAAEQVGRRPAELRSATSTSTATAALPARVPAIVTAPGLKAGAVRMLQQLARCGGTLTKAQLATLAQVNRQSGTFSDYLRAIVQAGYAEDGSANVRILEAGASAIGEAIRTTPPTTSEIVAMYGAKLKAGERRMLDVLVSAYPRQIRKVDLAEKARVNRNSGTFSDYLRRLRVNGLADVTPHLASASATLFLDGGAGRGG